MWKALGSAPSERERSKSSQWGGGGDEAELEDRAGARPAALAAASRRATASDVALSKSIVSLLVPAPLLCPRGTSPPRGVLLLLPMEERVRAERPPAAPPSRADRGVLLVLELRGVLLERDRSRLYRRRAARSAGEKALMGGVDDRAELGPRALWLPRAEWHEVEGMSSCARRGLPSFRPTSSGRFSLVRTHSRRILRADVFSPSFMIETFSELRCSALHSTWTRLFAGGYFFSLRFAVFLATLKCECEERHMAYH